MPPGMTALTTPVPPAAAKVPKRIEQLGRIRTDDYAWMKDENWQQVLRDPSVLRADIRAHLAAENAYTQAVLADTEALQEEILEEIKGRIKQDDATVPNPDGPWDYYLRYESGAQHPVHARKPRGQAHDEQVLVDADALAQGHQYYRLAAARHSPDHRLFAYAEDVQGSEVYRVRVKDLATGALLPEAIENCTGNFAWSSDSAWLFWTYRDENGRPVRIYRRPVRGGPGDDVLVYEEPDPGFFLRIAPSDSHAWLVIACGDQQTSEAWLIPASDPTATPRVVEERQAGVRYDLEHWDGRFIIRTNADGAVDFKLVSAPETAPSRANWRDWIAHEPGRFIVATAAYAGHFARLERVDANNRIVITSRGTGGEHVIAVDEEAFVLRLQGGYEYDTAVLRYTYESPTTPAPVVRLRYAEPRIGPPQDAGDPIRPRPGPLSHAPPACPRRGRGFGADHRADAPRHAHGRVRAAPALRLRRLRDRHGTILLRPQHQPRGPRLDLGDGPRARRLREGLGLVPRRARGGEAEHIHRLHRLGRAPGGFGPRAPRRHRGHGRIGGRPSWSARSRTCGPIYGPGSSPTCRSWTC